MPKSQSFVEGSDYYNTPVIEDLGSRLPPVRRLGNALLREGIGEKVGAFLNPPKIEDLDLGEITHIVTSCTLERLTEELELGQPILVSGKNTCMTRKNISTLQEQGYTVLWLAEDIREVSGKYLIYRNN